MYLLRILHWQADTGSLVHVVGYGMPANQGHKYEVAEL